MVLSTLVALALHVKNPNYLESKDDHKMQCRVQAAAIKAGDKPGSWKQLAKITRDNKVLVKLTEDQQETYWAYLENHDTAVCP